MNFSPTLVPEAFFYSLLANFATQTASYIFFIGMKRWEPRKESLWSRPLGTSLSCHQLLTVVSDWRTFLIALRVIWLDGLNIFGDGSGVYMFTFMGMGGELLLYQRILLPGKAKIFVVEIELPSSCTAFSQAFAVNWFRWRISDERPGPRDPKRMTEA